MVLTRKEAYHPVVGLMPSPLEQVPKENGWYKEKWATPYMAAVAALVFGAGVGLTALSHLRLGLLEPDVTLTPQVGAEKIIEKLGIGRTMPYIAQPQWPVAGLMPSPLEEVPEERITALGAEAEWFKENRILVIVVIVALVLLFFFLKKRRR